jgi:hypothetical protein
VSRPDPSVPRKRPNSWGSGRAFCSPWPLNFEELDDITRGFMLREFEAELAGNPYISDGLSPEGRAALPNLMRETIRAGNEESLAAALA